MGNSNDTNMTDSINNEIDLLRAYSGLDDQPVDFSEQAVKELLPIFDVHTPLDKIRVIMLKYERIIGKGKSVAVACGFKWVGKNKNPVHEMAEADLNGEERTQWVSWKKGGRMPPLDKVGDTLAAPTNPASLRIYKSRSVGLCVLYKDKGFSEENVAFFLNRYSVLAPLLCAATKIYAGERTLLSGQEKSTVMEMIEYATIHKIQSTSAAAIQKVKETLNKIFRDISSSSSVISTRLVVLRSKK